MKKTGSRIYGIVAGGLFIFCLLFSRYAFSETAKPYAVDQGTIALWHFDEGQGSVLKDAAGANQGSITGAAWSEGRFGKALKFDGTNYVDCGNAPALNPASALTVEAWFKLTNLDFEGRSWSNIVSKEGYRSGYYLDFYQGNLSCAIGTDRGVFAIEHSTPGYRKQTYDTDWHQAAMTYDGTTLSLYYDNSLIGSMPAAGAIVASPANLWLGSMNQIPARSFQGYIDEVRISNTARKIAEENLADILKDNTVIVKGLARGAGYLKEETARIVLGNDKVEFVFDKTRGGVLTDITDKRNIGVKFRTPASGLCGEWLVDMEGVPSFSSSGAVYTGGEAVSDEKMMTLTVYSRISKAGLTQTYSLKKDAPYLVCKTAYKNNSEQKTVFGSARYSLGNLAIGGGLENNRFICPPTQWHFIHGQVKDATPAYMNKYIYGSMQATGGMMLPYAMIYNDSVKECVTVAGVNSEAKVRVGVFGGDSGKLAASFDIFREIAPGETQEVGTVYLAALAAGWQDGMLLEKGMLMAEAGYRAPKTLPGFVKDLVIVADGIPGVSINTFDELGKTLEKYKDLGFNAINIGGRTWYCYTSGRPQEGGSGFIPIPQGGYIVPDPESGGMEGLKIFIAKAHSLGMKVFTWGPTSMAGINGHSEEVTTQPDWWVYKKDGTFNLWYSFPYMAPANPASPGWRAFFLKNVVKMVGDYGFDGFWLDSTWPDHALNYKAPDGWYGGPNGAKISLVSEIVKTAKAVNPDSVVMAEGGGAEVFSRVDLAYIASGGIWPAIAPEEVQEMVVVEELNRLPGVRPYGYVKQGLEFYPELDENSRNLAQKYSESWKARSFLVSTLDRIPYYWGLNWNLGIYFQGDNAVYPAGMENNPERLEAERSRANFTRWVSTLKQINRVRSENRELIEGETLFDSFTVSNPAIVHYLRHLPGQDSIVLLNADLVPQSVTLQVTKPADLGIKPGKVYQVKNLMTGKIIPGKNDNEGWLGSDIIGGKLSVTLSGYEGAVLKVLAR